MNNEKVCGQRSQWCDLSEINKLNVSLQSIYHFGDDKCLQKILTNESAEPSQLVILFVAQ